MQQKSYLVNNAVPSESSIVDDDVDLAITELSSFLDERIDEIRVKHVSRNRYCAAATCINTGGDIL